MAVDEVIARAYGRLIDRPVFLQIIEGVGEGGKPFRTETWGYASDEEASFAIAVPDPATDAGLGLWVRQFVRHVCTVTFSTAGSCYAAIRDHPFHDLRVEGEGPSVGVAFEDAIRRWEAVHASN